eukprot:3683429-Heterocapsa_arctica.AAC.1
MGGVLAVPLPTTTRTSNPDSSSSNESAPVLPALDHGHALLLGDVLGDLEEDLFGDRTLAEEEVVVVDVVVE